MAKGKARSVLSWIPSLSAHLRQMGIAQLRQEQGEEIWLVAGGSDLCKPYAEATPSLI